MLKKCLFATVATVGVITLCAITAHPASAIINYGSMRRNVTAPTGLYADSGWQYGGFVNHNGVVWPISENWALTAAHGTGPGTVGQTIVLNGVSHSIVEHVALAGTDVAMVRVTEAFASYAPLYSGGDETGKEMMVIGRGFSVKDQPIIQPITGTTAFRQVGHTFKNTDIDGDHVYSWGRNSVTTSRIINVGGVITDTLYATYDKPTLDDGSPNPNSVGADEAMAGFGDSGGGVFIQQGGEWRLAGVIWAIDAGIYDSPTSNGPWTGAISDYRDMWVTNDEGVREQVSGPDPLGAGFYASRVATYRSWIDTTTGQTAGLGVTVVPEAGAGQLAALGTMVLAGGLMISRRRR